jgi:hypothetical protein
MFGKICAQDISFLWLHRSQRCGRMYTAWWPCATGPFLFLGSTVYVSACYVRESRSEDREEGDKMNPMESCMQVALQW